MTISIDAEKNKQEAESYFSRQTFRNTSRYIKRSIREYDVLFFCRYTLKKSLLIVISRSFQKASIEIKQISIVYQQNRFAVKKKLICKMQN